MQGHYDTLKGIVGSSIGFLAYALTHSDVDKWTGTLAGLFGLALVLLTIGEKVHQWRQRNRRQRRFEAIARRGKGRSPLPVWLAMAGLGLMMGGCAGSRRPVAVVKAAAPVARAGVLAAQSRARVEKVRVKITTAQEALSLLQGTATAIQKPAIEKVSVALAGSQRLLRAELDENLILTASLQKAQDGLSQVLLEQERIVRELEKAQAKARAYWKLKLWIAGLAALVAGWVAWSFVPVILGPYKLYVAGAAGVAAFGMVMMIL